MLRRRSPLCYQHILIEHFNAQTSLVKRLGKQIGRKSCRKVVVKMARDYQELMKQIPVPMTRRKDAIFVSWLALANSMKQFYGQPLHYLTHVLKPMGSIIHPRRAESTIWDVEKVHRRCTSHTNLANLWLSDPGYHAFVHEVVPSSKSVA
ncbi:hypothetical protein D8674_031581 [Pyrus ussuriensis x Pyrus communis]|uniref:Uncharacterized protein n=1 Tax=Pyrus ussuriensis x Pyrus communis TaxID=2448454 RepID=A0A5N5F1V1_9ROSA|nr:hypothetical protein D8674_031581 [Pyrus ussuriensis x Pyrus communis]